MIFQQSPVADFCDQRFHPPAARFKGDSDVLQEQSLCRTLLCAACDGWTKDPGHTHNPIAILNILCSWTSRVLPCDPSPPKDQAG
jgi:hypothetical protein